MTDFCIKFSQVFQDIATILLIIKITNNNIIAIQHALYC